MLLDRSLVWVRGWVARFMVSIREENRRENVCEGFSFWDALQVSSFQESILQCFFLHSLLLLQIPTSQNQLSLYCNIEFLHSITVSWLCLVAPKLSKIQSLHLQLKFCKGFFIIFFFYSTQWMNRRESFSFTKILTVYTTVSL